MKKIIASICCLSAISFHANAQEPSFDNLGKFENFNQVYDTQTKKTRDASEAEIKINIAKEINARLQKIGSARRTNVNKIVVMPKIISASILDMDGTPFYVVIIDRETGFNNNDINTYQQKQVQDQNTQEWDKNMAEYEKRAEANKKAMDEYRKKYPTNPDDKFKIKLPDNIYKPKAPARKINIK